ncbi:hypothetical protein [Nonomuraea sp. KM90]|uniref:hypothetical protein n=1 Tax=Nonomuraea sp. KM90 TaxID=3457428 RepID=UPI003FCCAB71
MRAYDLLHMFARQGYPTPLGQAFAEYGAACPAASVKVKVPKVGWVRLRGRAPCLRV